MVGVWGFPSSPGLLRMPGTKTKYARYGFRKISLSWAVIL